MPWGSIVYNLALQHARTAQHFVQLTLLCCAPQRN